MPADRDDPIDALYAASPDDFVAARDALARALRADGDREGAAAVRALRKPTRAAWAVNAAVRERPQAAGELADAARRLQDVQQEVLAGGDPTLLRAADARAREAVDALAGAAPVADPATLDKVRATLRAAIADPGVLAEVLSGRLVRERVASGFGGFGFSFAVERGSGGGPGRGAGRRDAEGASGGEGATTAARGKGAGEAAGRGAKAVAGETSAADATRVRAERAAQARRRAQEKAARAAERARQRRQERIRRAREQEAEAQAEVDAARGALEQVEAVVRERREQLAAAEARLADARARVAREAARDAGTEPDFS